MRTSSLSTGGVMLIDAALRARAGGLDVSSVGCVVRCVGPLGCVTTMPTEVAAMDGHDVTQSLTWRPGWQRVGPCFLLTSISGHLSF